MGSEGIEQGKEGGRKGYEVKRKWKNMKEGSKERYSEKKMERYGRKTWAGKKKKGIQLWMGVIKRLDGKGKAREKY